MNRNRAAGVLMPISCLPGQYGIGVFDQNAYHFVDRLSEMGFSYWQVLPLGPVDDTGSPYCSASAFAGNLMFISPEELCAKGLVSSEDITSNQYTGSPFCVDFEFVLSSRTQLLKKAYSNIDNQLKKQITAYCKANSKLSEFALYMALKARFDGVPWYQWNEFSDYNYALNNLSEDLADSFGFWQFVQYEFFDQWQNLKAYANRKNIKIIGDIPIYLSLDSADVWANLPSFLIDRKTLRPQAVAGVPPDYFCEDGQLWGNPLYNWKQMEQNGFSWWTERLEVALKTYDSVRIDHFRAFASFWKIPYGAASAKEGKWVKGPGMKFFKPFLKNHPAADIIAEDLGVLGEDVIKLLHDTDFPGMKVAQFGFDPYADSLNAPHHSIRNSIYYTGTHDNNTLLGWLYEADDDTRRYVMNYCGFEGDNWGDGGFHAPLIRKIIQSIWQTPSKITILPLQDMCGFGADARLNTPGVAGGSWRWRTTSEFIDNIDTDYFKYINSLYCRIRPTPTEK